MVCPSNPIVSIGPLLAVPGVRDALVARRDDIIAVSPIVAGSALKGPADHLMAELGTEPSVVGVARLYAPWVSTLVIDEADRALARAGGGRGCALRGRTDRHGLPRPGRRAGPGGDRTPVTDDITLIPLTGIGEVEPGADLARTVAAALAPEAADGPELRQGDVLVITQKIVSKAEGRLVPIDHDDPAAKVALVEQESVRILRRRGDLIISETKHGFICANAGIDLSNVAARHGGAAARGFRPFRPADPGRPARPAGRRRRRDHLRHVRTDVAPRRHRRGDRLRRRGRRGRPERARRTPTAGTWWPPRCAWPTNWPRPPSS